ncbi:MAG: threonine ammonia-lyase [Bacteroidetes bacterium]|nr:threonine ammonia-lyase [Bacteroidota bacterium]
MAVKVSERLNIISVENIYKAKVRLKNVVAHTPLMPNYHLSELFQCQIHLKREDLQVVRSYKIRGAFNKMSQLSKTEIERGVICASAGNHGQGVAFACNKLGVHGKIYMPSVTPAQKVKKVKLFGKNMVEVILTGDSFDDAHSEALLDSKNSHRVFIHPFDDEDIIEGQGTVGLEVLEECDQVVDYVFAAVGGGGLISGLGSYFKQISPNTKIIGVEPAGAPAMYESLKSGKVITLKKIDNFVDGAAVKQVGDITFQIARQVVDDMILVPEGKVCSTILQLYNEEGIVAEPAGALTIAALDFYKEKIKDKNVVCVIGGSNNDITRTEEIKERSLLYEGLKHYFIIRFPQRAGALREFLNNVLGPEDNITNFEYTKKHNRESGPALVGIQVNKKEDYIGLIERMEKHNINYQTLNDSRMLFDLLI